MMARSVRRGWNRGGEFGLGVEQSVFDQEPVGRLNREFEVLMADVEIEKAVVRALEIDELAFVAPPPEFAAESLHLIERGDAVGLPVEQKHRWQLAAHEAKRAVLFGGLAVGKAFEALARAGAVDQGAEQQERRNGWTQVER